MCGISGIVGESWRDEQINAMLQVQHHRGPDAEGIYISPDHKVALAHNRLSILDLSEAGRQPIADTTGRYHIVFNGEVYNYLEIRSQLEAEFSFRTQTDTEVILNAYIKWGKACLDKFVGMFSIAIWDAKEKVFFAARDRFGVKPFNYAFDEEGNFYFASEIKTLHAAGIPAIANESAWAAYLAYGRYDHDENTFWKGVSKLPAGHTLTIKDGKLNISQWYDLADKTGTDYDQRSLDVITEEYYSLLQENIRFRFRSDVPVGINLSGGLDSSALLALVDKVQGKDSDVKAFTFYTGNDRYDELPWVKEMVAQTKHPLQPCLLRASDVPAMAASVQYHQDEPFGGIPTIAYAKLFEVARSQGVIVLLDGQGMDEQWAGYDYYRNANTTLAAPTVQGAKDSPVLIDTLNSDFVALAQNWKAPEKYPDKLRNLQYRDSFYTKIPRALRFNDRISMRSSTELREPFLDHRLFEVAFRQKPEYKIVGDQSKWFMRQLLKNHLPGKIVEAPKRPLQTPQREWLREDLRDWAEAEIQNALQKFGGAWLEEKQVKEQWKAFTEGKSDNSFYVWQWISISLLASRMLSPVSKEKVLQA
jgi:asparagine synthase (glutamine-hydrolysing)